MRLLRYVGIRLLLVIPVLLGVLVLTFLLVRVLPGDPVQAFVTPGMSVEDVERVRERLGLDIPLWQQFLEYFVGVFQGDFGTSIQTNTPIAVELALRVAPTLELALLAVLIALVIAVVLGIWSARRVGNPIDHVSRVGSLAGTALPEFWLGLVLIVVAYQWLHWAPAPSGRVDRDAAPAPITGAELIDAIITGNGPAMASALAHLWLPMLTIIVGASASLLRSVRAAALEILASPAWNTAVAHGVRGRTLSNGYLLRGTLSRLPTLVAIVLGNVLGTVVLVEQVFSWQGMGQWLLRGLMTRDYPVVQAGVLVIALVYAIAYLIADLLHAALDPRVRL
ncbi:ABC transporter permease [Agromyces aerolatus]|uniref:ABC transporter permease n=1 Tax=Agromyces sp. LY-1074 TaxID=3074080 RepID=UPI002858424F|nr:MULTISPECIES: ABC transporter permease [unclassified Agromyces]MDR5698341.1 ABC transporter permease [Agromyces sp. LY-1074]MDR5704635.1 ABC transporter permease [Agromyces sp. LY-1358]